MTDRFIKENLRDSFPEWTHPLLEGRSLEDLFHAFMDFTSSLGEEKEEARQRLELFYNNFKHICETHCHALHYKKLYDQKLTKERREIVLRKLYENHLELTKES